MPATCPVCHAPMPHATCSACAARGEQIQSAPAPGKKRRRRSAAPAAPAKPGQEPAGDSWLPVWISVVLLWGALGFAAWWVYHDRRPAQDTVSAVRREWRNPGEIRREEEDLRGWIEFQCAVVGLLLTGLMLWTARDTRARGVERWAWVPVFIPLTGGLFFFVYLLSRPQGPLTPCSRCGGERLLFARACPHCGQRSYL